MTEEELARHDSKTLLQLLLSADARCDTLTAERDRLRGGIEYILDGYGLAGPDYRFPYGEEDADWITDHLIAALKGESHE